MEKRGLLSKGHPSLRQMMFTANLNLNLLSRRFKLRHGVFLNLKLPVKSPGSGTNWVMLSTSGSRYFFLFINMFYIFVI